MASRPDPEKPITLFGNLDGVAFEFCNDTLASNGELADEAKKYSIVKQKVFKRFIKEEDPQDVIRKALEVWLNIEEISGSLKEMDLLYEKVCFDKFARFGH